MIRNESVKYHGLNVIPERRLVTSYHGNCRGNPSIDKRIKWKRWLGFARLGRVLRCYNDYSRGTAKGNYAR